MAEPLLTANPEGVKPLIISEVKVDFAVKAP
jgi:hypothetical protein